MVLISRFHSVDVVASWGGLWLMFGLSIGSDQLAGAFSCVYTGMQANVTRTIAGALAKKIAERSK